jgi:hypothetical protein
MEFAMATAMKDEDDNLLFVAPPPMDLEGATLKSVIEDYDLAETVYYCLPFSMCEQVPMVRPNTIWILLTGSTGYC